MTRAYPAAGQPYEPTPSVRICGWRSRCPPLGTVAPANRWGPPEVGPGAAPGARRTSRHRRTPWPGRAGALPARMRGPGISSFPGKGLTGADMALENLLGVGPYPSSPQSVPGCGRERRTPGRLWNSSGGSFRGGRLTRRSSCGSPPFRRWRRSRSWRRPGAWCCACLTHS